MKHGKGLHGVYMIYIFFRACQGVMAILANLLTLVCLLKFRKLFSAVNTPVASLAIGDFLHGMVVGVLLPMRVVFSFTLWQTAALCKTNIVIESISVLVDLCSFSLMAIERLNSLRSQLNKTRRFSGKTILAVTIVGWVAIISYFSIVASISPMPLDEEDCFIPYFLPRYVGIIGMIMFITTTAITLISYGAIACIVRSSKNQVASGMTSSSQQQQEHQTDIRITRMMAMVVGVFFMLYMPAFINMLVITVYSPMWLTYLRYVTILFSDVNFWINPVIYAWRNQNFRKAISSVLYSMCGPLRQCRDATTTATNEMTGNKNTSTSKRTEMTRLKTSATVDPSGSNVDQVAGANPAVRPKW